MIKGSHLTQEHKNNISLGHRNKILTEEDHKKISLRAKKGWETRRKNKENKK